MTWRVVCVDRCPVNTHTQDANTRIERAYSLPQPLSDGTEPAARLLLLSQTHARIIVCSLPRLAPLSLASTTCLSLLLSVLCVFACPQNSRLPATDNTPAAAAALLVLCFSRAVYIVPPGAVLSGRCAGTAPFGSTLCPQHH